MLVLKTTRLHLALQTPEEALAMIEALSPEARAEVSPAWLARVAGATEPDPWVHGFTIRDAASGEAVGNCGFAAPPDQEGGVELAYGIDEAHRGQGFATEACAALAEFALRSPGIRTVRAHTRQGNAASMRVLEKCGFTMVGEVAHPEDGLVLVWERARPD